MLINIDKFRYICRNISMIWRLFVECVEYFYNNDVFVKDGEID